MNFTFIFIGVTACYLVEGWDTVGDPFHPSKDSREAAHRERLKVAENNKARMRFISSIAHDLKT